MGKYFQEKYQPAPNFGRTTLARCSRKSFALPKARALFDASKLRFAGDVLLIVLPGETSFNRKKVWTPATIFVPSEASSVAEGSRAGLSLVRTLG